MGLTTNKVGLATEYVYDTGNRDILLNNPDEVKATYVERPVEVELPFISVDGVKWDKNNKRTQVEIYTTIEQAKELRSQLDNAIKESGA